MVCRPKMATKVGAACQSRQDKLGSLNNSLQYHFSFDLVTLQQRCYSIFFSLSGDEQSIKQVIQGFNHGCSISHLLWTYGVLC